MLFANFMRRSGAQFITSLVVMFNGTPGTSHGYGQAVQPSFIVRAQTLAKRPESNGSRGAWVSIVLPADAVTIAPPDHAPAPTRSASQTPSSLLPTSIRQPCRIPVSLFRMKLNGSHAWNASMRWRLPEAPTTTT